MILERVEHAPNPQLVREGYVDLCGEWEFSWDDDNVGMTAGWSAPDAALDQRITVPFPPESARSGIGDTGYHPICWYRRTFADPRQNQSDRALLRFGAVDYSATVWVNGRWVGTHDGGSTPFALDITHAIDTHADVQVVTLRAFDDPHDLEQPRGKQDWLSEPHAIWYHRTSGIWQPVWIESVPMCRVEDLHWTFDRATWSLGAQVTLNRPAEPGSSLEIELEIPGGGPVAVSLSISGRSLRAVIDMSPSEGIVDPRNLLWSPTSPTLIGARVSLRTDAGVDTFLTYTGLRTVNVDEHGVAINGVPLFLRMVLSQGYWPESHLAAPSREVIAREVDLILGLGFNGARLHQKAEDPRFLFEADRRGLLVWSEIGSAFRWSERAIERHAAEWREIVMRDRNHPSVIAWVPFNESWGVDDIANRPEQRHAVQATYHATHALDGTRPVSGNDGWENAAADIVTAHDYSWDPDHLSRLYGMGASRDALPLLYRAGHRRLLAPGMDAAGKPVMLTEFGGVSFAPASDEEWFGYGTVSGETEFVDRLRALVQAVTPSDAIAGFCYTQLTDTLQETNGLLTERREPKAPLETLRAIITGEIVEA